MNTDDTQPADPVEEAEPQCLFKHFPSLPPELRHLIWGVYIDSLPDTPGLLIHEPSEFPPLENLPTAPTVYTGFPATMHVSHEARCITRGRISFVKASTTRCMVPVRAFRPASDVLYIPWEAWRSFFLLKEFYYKDEWIRRLRHVAIDICFSTNLAAFFRQVHYLPALRSLRFVLASRQGHASLNSMLILPTPITRYVLHPFPDREGDEEGDEGGEENGSVRCVVTHLLQVNERAWEVAKEAVETAPTAENRAAVERLIDAEGERLTFSIGASVLMKYRCSRKGSGFVEIGRKSVTDLVLRIR